ncbi:guanitoxin biosynthesis MATE family efflux transporter GntT [Pleurocapsa sp. CCALA 161]|uniref:guanitoxin biosynthesis MATE family efflux transporter GntT n=1 Tax=Pleurocapsa sp. CCALA 161 TaxID=2107688 RepID=UPI0018EB59F2|nr:guanitoxin biosynthesis MATE family efflux transporter GntT [Pleurocapsa sp. CCALA 161]
MNHYSSALDRQRRFWQLAIVNVISNLMVPMASLVDMAFLGHLTEIKHLAGVAIATVLFNYIYWTFGFLRMGTTGLTAQARGRGDREVEILTLLRNSAIALVIGIIILLLQQPLREIGFVLLQADPEVLQAGKAYYNALIWGAPATLLNFVLLGWFLGREQKQGVFLISLINNGANIILDYLFVVRWGQESGGAGAATALSQLITLIVGLILADRQLREISRQEQRSLRQLIGQIWEISAFKAAFSLNKDILIRTLALVSTFALFTNLSAMMGTTTLAGNTLLLQVVTLAAYFIDGIAFATESMAGNLHGQGAKGQLLPLLQLAGSVSLMSGLGFAAMFSFFPLPLFGLLTSHPKVIQHIGSYLWWLFPVLGFGSIAYMLDGYFLGLTAGKILRQSTLIAALIGFAPMATAAWYWQMNHLLWLALALFMATRSITLGWKINY